jgi:hypothetical protein
MLALDNVEAVLKGLPAPSVLIPEPVGKTHFAQAGHVSLGRLVVANCRDFGV